MLEPTGGMNWVPPALGRLFTFRHAGPRPAPTTPCPAFSLGPGCGLRSLPAGSSLSHCSLAGFLFSEPTAEWAPWPATTPDPAQSKPTVRFLSKAFITRKQIRGNKNKQPENYQDKGGLAQPLQPASSCFPFTQRLNERLCFSQQRAKGTTGAGLPRMGGVRGWENVSAGDGRRW